MPNIHAINADGTEYGIEAENGVSQAQAEKIATIGNVADLTTTAKSTLVSAINEVDGHADAALASIGTLANLITSDKTTLVGAINSAQEVLNNILNSYGNNVTADIHSDWISEMNSMVNDEATYTPFTLFSMSRKEGFLIGWKKGSGDVNALFMYGTITGVAFRRNGTWSFYSILKEVEGIDDI